MSAKIAMILVLRERSGQAVGAGLPPSTIEGPAAVNFLIDLLAGAASGRDRARLIIRVDDHGTTQAARTLTITGASVTAGEWIEFLTPTGRYRVTGVASGSVDGDRTFVVSGTSNTAAANIRQAINTHPELKLFVVASGSTNSVVITANPALASGTIGNSIEIIDGTGGGIGTVGLLTGGRGVAAPATATVTITHANVTAGDSVVIGGVAFTAVASGATGNQWNIGADATADAVNIAAAVNANAILQNRITASPAGAVVTLTYVGLDPVTAQLIQLFTNDAAAFAFVQPTPPVPTTVVVQQRSYNLGVNAS